MKVENPFDQQTQTYKGGTALQQAAAMLIEDTLDFVEHDKHWVHIMPSLQYSYDFATVKIGGRRQQGHTELVKSYLNDVNYKACAVVPTSNIRNVCYNQHTKVATPTLIERFALSQRGTTQTPVDLCFIEPMMQFDIRQVDRIYEAMFYCTKVFVQLQ